MTGDAPQPGETPRSAADPWSFADPDTSWWRGETDPGAGDDSTTPVRHPRRRPPQNPPATGGTGVLLPAGYDRADPRLPTSQPPAPQPTSQAGEPQLGGDPTAAGAYAAAARDVAEELDPEVKQRAPEPAPKEPRIEAAGIERDHNQPDPFRYDPLRPPAGYTAQTVAAQNLAAQTAVAAQAVAAQAVAAQAVTAQAPADQAVTADQAAVGPSAAAEAKTAKTEPGPTDVRPEDPKPAEPVEVPDDVMVLPEPNPRNRPTVPLERGPVPGQPPGGRSWLHTAEPLPRPTGSPETDARLEKLENSPFWLSEQERAAAPAGLDIPAHTALGSRRSPRHANPRPAAALFGLLVLAMVATFFAWVSAEPFWLAVGHGDPGYATTAHCTGSGVTQRCTGQFAAADGGFSVSRVTLLGVAAEQRADGTITTARMVGPQSRQAYLGDNGVLVQLRWIIGFVLVLLCGYGIAGLTGARRLETARARRGAVLVSLAGPVVLLGGFLLAAY
ncbi:hypothetical protein ACWKSP_33035 [Micromonosporaceae bacterium Da 78-11]